MTSWRPTLSGLLQPWGGYRRWAALLTLLAYLFAATTPAMAGTALGGPGGGLTLVTCHVVDGVAVIAVPADPADHASADSCCPACPSAQLGQGLPGGVAGLAPLSARSMAMVPPQAAVIPPRDAAGDHRARAPPVA